MKGTRKGHTGVRAPSASWLRLRRAFPPGKAKPIRILDQVRRAPSPSMHTGAHACLGKCGGCLAELGGEQGLLLAQVCHVHLKLLALHTQLLLGRRQLWIGHENLPRAPIEPREAVACRTWSVSRVMRR